MDGAAAMSGAIAGSLESSSRSGLVTRRACSCSGSDGRVRAEVVAQRLDVGRTAGRVADGVEPQLDRGQPGLGIEAGGQLDDLGVDGGPGSPIASTSNCQNWR